MTKLPEELVKRHSEPYQSKAVFISTPWMLLMQVQDWLASQIWHRLILDSCCGVGESTARIWQNVFPIALL